MDKETKEKIKKEEKKEEMVTVPKTFWDNLQNDIDALKKKQGVLEAAADKRALSLVYQRSPEELGKIISIRAINGKVIMGWRSTQDEVVLDIKFPGRGTEIQKTEILYQNGTSEEMLQTEFNLRYEKIPCKVDSTITDAKGNIAYKLVRIDNGDEITIGSQFVN